MSTAAIINHDPDETKAIADLASEVLEDSQRWLDNPHPSLGGKSPNEMVKAGESGVARVRNLLRSIKHGQFS